MREEDRQVLEEAIRNSGSGEDFDEMLLRATKKHLPRNYHRQFSVFLEEILAEADRLGASNRSAAQSLAGRPVPGPAAAPMQGPATLPPAAQAPPARTPDSTEEFLSRLLDQPSSPSKAGAAGGRSIAPVPPPDRAAGPEPGPEAPSAEGPGPEEADPGPSEGSVEKLPEEQKILDLGGTSPESLSPELQDKLRKLVKAQKLKHAWEEGSSEEEPVPGLFFKGQQRAPPFVPLTKPVKKEEGNLAPAGKEPEAGDEEDLDEPAPNDAKTGK